VYVTGESYAGRYVPYISAAMLDAKDREYYDLKGALMYDPCIGEFGYGGQVAAYPHLEANRNIWGLNDTFMADLASQHESCGYREYNDKYLTFPPSGNQPPTFNDYRNATCDVMGLASGWAVNVNPCFNPYQIVSSVGRRLVDESTSAIVPVLTLQVEQCPMPYDVLGNPSTFNYTVPGTKIYFQRPEVIEAIHAPKEITQWSDCAKNPVFTAKLAGPQQRGDTSPDPIQGVLPQIIEATNRVLVANGDWGK
jgi:carboxypeptidase D